MKSAYHLEKERSNREKSGSSSFRSSEDLWQLIWSINVPKGVKISYVRHAIIFNLQVIIYVQGKFRKTQTFLVRALTEESTRIYFVGVSSAKDIKNSKCFQGICMELMLRLTIVDKVPMMLITQVI